MIKNAHRYILGIVLLALFLIGNWNAMRASSANAFNPYEPVVSENMSSWRQLASNIKPKGIRLATPIVIIPCCGSQQTGCEKLSLCLSILGPSCQIPGTFNARVKGGVAPYTFTVTDPNGIPVVTSPPSSEGAEVSVTFAVNKVGPYTVTVRDANGCRATCREQPRLGVSIEPISSLCISATFKASVSGGVAPYTFRVTDRDGIAIATSEPTTDGSRAFITFTATKTGGYLVTVTDANGCQGQDGVEGVACSSLTQSEWGKKKPKFNGEKRNKTIKRLFKESFAADAALNSLLVVGVPGERSVTFTQDSQGCIMDRLPASGSPAPLPSGLGNGLVNPNTCQTPSPLPLLNDKFQNGLLGQTIALTLNAGGLYDGGGLTPDALDFPALWHLVICNNMVTQRVLPGGDGKLGTRDDVADPGTDGLLGTQDDPTTTIIIPASVINAIAPGSTLEAIGKFTVPSALGPFTLPASSVARLLMLANLALAGETNLGGSNIADINAAVDGVNRAFDGGRFLIKCASGGPPANLQITFSPDPVQQDTTRSCSTTVPSWLFNATLNERNGVGVTITRFTWDFFDSNGNFLFTQTNTSEDFANFFNDCGPRTSRIAPNGRVCGGLCVGFGDRRSSASLIMTFQGTDDNGNQVSFASGRLILLGSG